MNRLKVLPEGIPSIIEYDSLLKSDSFFEMESFSKSFVKKHRKEMAGYSRRWTADSLHLWSRQWEYPFAFTHIHKFIEANKEKEEKILDAGSGCTFFPYYIAQEFPKCAVYCTDNDPSLTSNFSKINRVHERVHFSINDLAHLNFDSDYFGIIYCVSVLEHATDYSKILGEFKRVLKNEGLLILTFDISLDKKSQLAIEEASMLLETLFREFKHSTGLVPIHFRQDIKNRNILSTRYMRDSGNKKLLPWRYTTSSVIRKLINLQIPRRPFFDLTVF